MAAPKEISDGKTYMHIYYARHPSHHRVIIHDSHVVGFAQTNPGSDVTGWLDPPGGWGLPLQKTRKYVSTDCLDWQGGKFCHYEMLMM
jgi:hypothetical protein